MIKPFLCLEVSVHGRILRGKGTIYNRERYYRHPAGKSGLSVIQDRMPVIIEQEDWPLCLSEAEGDPKSLLRAAPEDVLRVWPVDKKVGNFRNDGPELLEPRPLDEADLSA